MALTPYALASLSIVIIIVMYASRHRNNNIVVDDAILNRKISSEKSNAYYHINMVSGDYDGDGLITIIIIIIGIQNNGGRSSAGVRLL